MSLAEKGNKLASLSRSVWGDSAVEFLVGALSSVVSEQQLDILIDALEFVDEVGHNTRTQ